MNKSVINTNDGVKFSFISSVQKDKIDKIFENRAKDQYECASANIIKNYFIKSKEIN